MKAVVATVTSIGATTAFASCKDSGWGFSKWERVEITGARVKENNSSAYGSVLTGGDRKNCVTYFEVVDSNGDVIRDQRTGEKVRRVKMIAGNSADEVINFAYENGYRKVCMKISRDLGFMGVEGTGLWSPDYCRP